MLSTLCAIKESLGAKEASFTVIELSEMFGFEAVKRALNEGMLVKSSFHCLTKSKPKLLLTAKALRNI